jgi:pimeloyl-ACP methyl ester carboxylesterase
MPAQLTELKIGDVAIRLHRAGSGPKLLFLHGAGGVPQWLPFFDALADHYEVLVPEHPGFGGSDDPPWIQSMSDLAMFYLDLIEQAGLDRIHLIGNSLGGWLSAEILIRDRSRFRSLTLLAPAGIRVKGIPCGDNFIWGPEEAVRNLYHDQIFADRILALTPSEAQMDLMLKNRFTIAKLGWQPRWFNPDLEIAIRGKSRLTDGPNRREHNPRSAGSLPKSKFSAPPTSILQTESAPASGPSPSLVAL